MEIDKFTIPRSLDDPDVLCYCTMTEIALFGVCLMFGLFLKAFGIGFVAGACLIYLSKKVKSKIGTDQLVTMLYWHFPAWLSDFKSLPYSSKRKYIG